MLFISLTTTELKNTRRCCQKKKRSDKEFWLRKNAKRGQQDKNNSYELRFASIKKSTRTRNAYSHCGNKIRAIGLKTVDFHDFR